MIIFKHKSFNNVNIIKEKERVNLNNRFSVSASVDQFKYLKTKHSWHLVDPSPWPLVASLGAFFMTSGGVLYMHNFIGGGQLCLTGLTTILYRNCVKI